MYGAEKTFIPRKQEKCIHAFLRHESFGEPLMGTKVLPDQRRVVSGEALVSCSQRRASRASSSGDMPCPGGAACHQQPTELAARDVASLAGARRRVHILPLQEIDTTRKRPESLSDRASMEWALGDCSMPVSHFAQIVECKFCRLRLWSGSFNFAPGVT